MKVTWLTQAGLLIETCGKKILIDPYLSDSVEKINPNNYRRIPVDEDFYKIRPDILVLTHDHLDHTDPETLEKYLKDYTDITVLASKNAWQTARAFGGSHNYVMFNANTVWTQGGITFSAVRAEHSDDYAIGVVIDDGKERYYITGDTLYNTSLFCDAAFDIDVLFLPINGVGNNMNMTDAALFAEKIKAKKVVPIHYGLFDELNPNDFKCNGKTILTPYKGEEL